MTQTMQIPGVIDPGSRTTGIAIVRENGEKQIVLSLMKLIHRASGYFNIQMAFEVVQGVHFKDHFPFF